jgi:hypothetical protein
MYLWLELEDIHEIQYDDHTQATVVWDIDGNERIRMRGHIPEDVMYGIVRLCNRVWADGRRVGRAEKAGEIRAALAEGEEGQARG